jgi:hypothetical protein
MTWDAHPLTLLLAVADALPRLALIWADSAYLRPLQTWVWETLGRRLQIVERPGGRGGWKHAHSDSAYDHHRERLCVTGARPGGHNEHHLQPSHPYCPHRLQHDGDVAEGYGGGSRAQWHLLRPRRRGVAGGEVCR